MIPVLATALIVVALVAALWSLLLTIFNQPITLRTKTTLGLAVVALVLEVGLLVMTVVGIVALIGADREVQGATFVGYLLTAALLPVGGAFWAVGERSRWGSGVLTVVFLSVPVLIVRLNQIWAGHA